MSSYRDDPIEKEKEKLIQEWNEEHYYGPLYKYYKKALQQRRSRYLGIFFFLLCLVLCNHFLSGILLSVASFLIGFIIAALFL